MAGYSLLHVILPLALLALFGFTLSSAAEFPLRFVEKPDIPKQFASDFSPRLTIPQLVLGSLVGGRLWSLELTGNITNSTITGSLTSVLGGAG